MSKEKHTWFDEVWVPITDRDPGDESPVWIDQDNEFPRFEHDPPSLGSPLTMREHDVPPGLGQYEPDPRALEELRGLLSPPRHPASQKFHAYLEEAAALHDIKQMDYGLAEDPFANVRASEEWGMEGWLGAMVRLTDKVRRLQSLARTGNLSNEGAIDSFMDIAVYAIIARVLFEEREEEAA